MTDSKGFLNDLDELNKFVVIEQELLWDDLNSAMRNASVGGAYPHSILCRLVRSLRVVPPTSPYKIQWHVLAGGVYDAVLQTLEIPYEQLSDVEWFEFDKIMHKYGERDTLERRYEATKKNVIRIILEIQEKQGSCYGDD